MRKRIAEHTILFISVLKWSFLATIMGCIVGAATAIFLKTLAWGTKAVQTNPYYFLLIPVAFFVSALLVKVFAPDAEGHGTEKVIEALHQHEGRINPAVVPVKLIATVVTLAFGGSAGKEGPCAQIGAGLASLFAVFFKFDVHDRKKLLICGVSAGFASVFGTPLAGALFGVEVLFIGTILYDVLLPSFIAGVIGFHVASTMGATYFHYSLQFMPVFNEFFFVKVCMAGVFFGLCSSFLVESLNAGSYFSRKLKMSKPVKGLIGGAVLVLLAFVFSTKFLGLGLDTIESCLQGAPIPWYSFLVKSIFTGITLGFGGSGGIVTPIFFVGTTAGSLFASWFHLDPGTFAAIGFVALLAGATNTPIAASVMAVELFGTEIAPYATVACVISFLMTGHRSVYHSQILAIQKSPSIAVKVGEEVDKLNPTVILREKGWTKHINDFFDLCVRVVQRKKK